MTNLTENQIRDIKIMVELSDHEREARTLIETDRATAEFSSYGQMIRKVFRSEFYSAFDINEIASIASALGGHHNEKLANHLFLPELDRMIAAGVLRARMQDGDRLYEVNFAK